MANFLMVTTLKVIGIMFSVVLMSISLALLFTNSSRISLILLLTTLVGYIMLVKTLECEPRIDSL